jgi:hypothetical protein
MIELIGAVLVLSILAFIIGTVVKGTIRFVGFLVLAALAVMAIGQPLTTRLPAVSDWLNDLSARIQSDTSQSGSSSGTGESGETGGAGGFRSTPFTDAQTNQPITQASPQAAPNTTAVPNTTAAPNTTTPPTQSAPNTTTPGTPSPSPTTPTQTPPTQTVSPQATPFPRPRSDSDQGSPSGNNQPPVTAWW